LVITASLLLVFTPQDKVKPNNYEDSSYDPEKFQTRNIVLSANEMVRVVKQTVITSAVRDANKIGYVVLLTLLYIVHLQE
jgi:hypothetical protein